MQHANQFDVFLSHCDHDKATVRALAQRLQGDGLKVWFDDWAIRVGDSIPWQIEEGLKHSIVLVLCMSARAFESDWARLESYTFRFRDPLNKKRRLIPLLSMIRRYRNRSRNLNMWIGAAITTIRNRLTKRCGKHARRCAWRWMQRQHHHRHHHHPKRRHHRPHHKSTSTASSNMRRNICSGARRKPLC